ncbi:MAG TPA: FAD-dependent oxidoreductase [Thermodesulfobacteriota bacterium]|nr:FAD-dependent oxidoreductase [Thermodesulfobacteriota bacterium]
MIEGRAYKPVIRSEGCHSCDICIRGCPAEIFSEYRKEDKTLRGALYREKIQGKISSDKVPLPPCQEACPIHQDTKGYVALIAEGKFKEALELIREVNPLPAVCGFICHHPCEEACLRGVEHHPVPVRLLKRFVAEHQRLQTNIGNRSSKKKRGKILVIGSGPAGLTAANDLSLLGYKVTIFESLPVLGGMLAVGIPEFRLPKEILKIEIDRIKALGVEMKTHHPFFLNGEKRTFQKLGFQAVFLSIGAHKSLNLNIEGKNLEGILSGLEFLKRVHTGEKIFLGERVMVIGGGNVAVDVSRTAWRLGASKVEMFCLESRKEMPAVHEEVGEAKQEGIKLHVLAVPIRFIGKGGKAIGVEFKRLGLTKKSTFKVYSDTIITAIGQKVDRDFLSGLEVNLDGTVRTDQRTCGTSMRGVFAGGDVVTGPGWAIDAIAAGKRGAECIHQYLSEKKGLV